MHPDLRFALSLADLADTLTLERFRAPDLEVDTKPDSTPVTEVDRRVETALRERITAERRDEAVVGEEFGDAGDTKGPCWYLDPVDGTKNFARGVPVWATLIALRENGRARCAVVSAPALQRRWFASHGDGAWDGAQRRLLVSQVDRLSGATLSCTDFRDFTGGALREPFLRLADECKIVRGFGDFWSHMLVAEGVVDVAVEIGTSAWDVAPVQLIVEEAGGRFTDLDGHDTIDSRSAVSSNGRVHDAVVRIINAR